MVLYISTTSESLTHLANKFGFNIVFPNTLINLKYVVKMDPMSHHDMVYKIFCHNCDVSYIGQIKRQIGN